MTKGGGGVKQIMTYDYDMLWGGGGNKDNMTFYVINSASVVNLRKSYFSHVYMVVIELTPIVHLTVPSVLGLL